MKKFSLSVLSICCVLGLAACGGGSEGGSTSPTTPTMSDLEKAKTLASDAHLMITDAKAIHDAYDPVVSTIDNPAMSGLNQSIDLLFDLQNDLFLDAVESQQSLSLKGSEIDQLDEFYGYSIKASDDATVNVTTNGDVTINGTFTLKPILYAYVDLKGNKVYEFGDEFTSSVKNMKFSGSNVLTASKVFTSNLASQGSIQTKAQGTTATLVLEGSGVNTVTESFDTSLTYKQRLTSTNADDFARKLDVSLKGVRVTTDTPQTTIVAQTLLLSGERVNAKVVNSSQTVTLELPTRATVIGQVSMPEPKTDLSIDVTATVTPSSQTLAAQEYCDGYYFNGAEYVCDPAYELEENASAFLKGVFSVKLKGTTTVNTKNVPLDIVVSGKRDSYTTVQSTEIVLNVNQRKLIAEVTATDNVDVPMTHVKITSSVGSYTEFKLDENSDFVGDAPIKVGNTTYGSLLKQSSGMVSAKFNDNFIIVL